MRVLARHIVSQLELRRYLRKLASARQEGGEAKKELEDARAEIAKLRGELSASKAGGQPARRTVLKKSRR